MSATIPAPVKAKLVPDLSADEAINTPGAYEFYVFGDEAQDAPPAGIVFRCPCGCKVAFSFRFRQYKDQAGPIWTWDGNREAPSCTPSIQTYESDHVKDGKVVEHGAPHWHGFLTNGEFTQA